MIGVVVLTLGDTGEHLISDAAAMLNERPQGLVAFSGGLDRPTDKLEAALRSAIDSVDSGDGVIILADLYGATHTNIVCRILDPARVVLVSGVSLAMLIRVLNYRELSLSALTEKAVAAGRDGVISIDAPGCACRSTP